MDNSPASRHFCSAVATHARLNIVFGWRVFLDHELQRPPPNSWCLYWRESLEGIAFSLAVYHVFEHKHTASFINVSDRLTGMTVFV